VSGSYSFPVPSIAAGLFVALFTTQTALPEIAPGTDQKDRTSESNSVRANIDVVLATLSGIAMKEKISRFAGVAGVARKLDSFEAQVSLTDGVEEYTGVRGHHRTFHHVSEIGGLWSFGEIVTMLRTTRDIIDSSVTNKDHRAGDILAGNASDREEASDPRIIWFQGASADHKWFVTAHGRIHWLDFEGSIRISRRTGEIERLTWASTSGLAGTDIAGILWEVNFNSANVAGNACIIPSDSIFRVFQRGPSQTAQWNLTQYIALGRYGSSVNVRYGQ
jgi:hypothetical protein